MKSLFSRTALIALLSAGLGFTSAAHALDAKQKQEMGEFIKEYLIAHPEIMLDVQDALQKKQEAARAVAAEQAVKTDKDAIFNAKTDIALGNPKGNVTIVEFFDYNCGYCRHALSDMDQILKSDPNVRFVLKEFPILGPDSVAAHRVSAALKQLAPEKYGEFHRELLGSGGRATEASAMEVATSLGLKEADLRKAMADNPNDAAVQQAYQLAQNLGINGTPAYIVGNEVISGAVGADELEQKLKNLRSCGKSTC
ncbi:DsbA family protein [Rhizobium paknamense]|uniref:Protein-disulfide isomerase n=1 Tax=Rhizobium paknamense TaxID=1206817 RepID=A0ABU0I6W5_9HYPH|nr:DsbA family protein [Rhizobium paknamense]MDQ0453961.1 protein-disulfide isomerase [Rhizobium paknamense]